MCESEDNCINGGWLHPECTTDLFKMSQEQIDKLDKWYCEDCVIEHRLNQGNQPQLQSTASGLNQNIKKEMGEESALEFPSNSTNVLVQQQGRVGSREYQKLPSANLP